ncbi:MAG TPA: TolC family protein [Kofleriaceae bacterium]
MRSIVIALILIPALAGAEPPKLTLEQVIAKAIANPRVQMAESDRDAAAARVDEADAARLPRLKGTAFGTLSPEINCLNPECSETDPQNFAWRFEGFFGGAQLDLTQPLFTFGKLAHARSAARAGLDAQQALANEAAGDAAADAAKAYWGLKLARELGYMLEDGIETITKAQEGFEDRKDVTIQDRQRVSVLLAEARAQRADAAQAEAQALAGLRAITNTPDADIDDTELLPIERPMLEAAQLTAAAKRRPQSVAAASGARAADDLAELQAAYYFPDLALVGSAFISRAQGVTDPPGVFANDPYNRSGAGLVLALQWQIEPWTVKARTERARAEAHKMKAQSALAALGASYDAETSAAEARAARAKLEATTDGEKAARAWLASVLQNEAVGTAEAKDLADAYIAWFQMKARWAQAVFQWNVAVVRVGRATGEFRASAPRPR